MPLEHRGVRMFSAKYNIRVTHIESAEQQLSQESAAESTFDSLMDLDICIQYDNILFYAIHV